MHRVDEVMEDADYHLQDQESISEGKEDPQQSNVGEFNQRSKSAASALTHRLVDALKFVGSQAHGVSYICSQLMEPLVEQLQALVRNDMDAVMSAFAGRPSQSNSAYVPSNTVPPPAPPRQPPNTSLPYTSSEHLHPRTIHTHPSSTSVPSTFQPNILRSDPTPTAPHSQPPNTSVPSTSVDTSSKKRVLDVGDFIRASQPGRKKITGKKRAFPSTLSSNPISGVGIQVLLPLFPYRDGARRLHIQGGGFEAFAVDATPLCPVSASYACIASDQDVIFGVWSNYNHHLCD